MPVISREHWQSDFLSRYSDKMIGYDLPCLLSARRRPKGRIMLCAQDPFRPPTKISDTIAPSLTVGTFFGIDNEWCRARRHWAPVWNFIRQSIFAGYDVWVTDAIKIFAGKNVVSRDPDLRSLCHAIIQKEIAMFNPQKFLTFGHDARNALAASGITERVAHTTHPTARGIRGPFRERPKIYSQALFGTDQPQ